METNGHRIILGSASPRRKALLGAIEVPFTIDTGNTFEESVPEGTPYEQVPVMMSEGKSLGFHRPLESDEILITADTMVILPPEGGREGEILGKPRDREDAARMLRDLSGRMHHVVTAVTLRSATRMETFTDKTEVWFKRLKDAEIYHYIDVYKPFDKAGSYGAQDWIGCVGMVRIDGSYFNVMGLPVHRLYEELERFVAGD